MKRVAVALFLIGCHQSLAISETHVTSGTVVDAVRVEDTVPAASRSCPEGSVLVDGDFCPSVEEVCLRHVDPMGHAVPAPIDGSLGRCAEFRNPTRCLSAHKVHMRFCIDVYEWPGIKGQRPASWMSWYDAKNACEGVGKRLCTSSEWTFAAEGPNMHPYPFGDGYHRDRTSCNFDNPTPAGLDVFRARTKGDVTSVALDALLVPSGTMPKCVSDFGVYDLAGNVDEWVVNESGHPYVSGLKGGHVFGVRNASRPMTEGHRPTFAWYETSTRCCVNPQ